jgi:hypothetical protein
MLPKVSQMPPSPLISDVPWTPPHRSARRKPVVHVLVPVHMVNIIIIIVTMTESNG